MRWGKDEVDDDGFGLWRYGADADAGPSSANVSSFDAINSMVSALGDPSQFPDIRRLVVAGHSSGGQLAQRWVMLSGIDIWEGGREDKFTDGRQTA